MSVEGTAVSKVAEVAKSFGARDTMNLLALALFGWIVWSLVTQVIVLERAIEQRLVRIEETMEDSDQRMESRAQRWISAIERLGRLDAAICYLLAETDGEIQRCAQADVSGDLDN